MGNIHRNGVMQWHKTDRLSQMEGIWCDLTVEMHKGHVCYGNFNSSHELYAVLKEELDEFWDSVKENDPDPRELLQIAAVALSGALQLAEQGREEMENRKRLG